MPEVRRAFAVGRTVYKRGRHLAADDPVVKGREKLFRNIETATAAPGEIRNTRIPAATTCSECGFEAKTTAGLQAHQRSKHSQEPS